MAQKTTPNRRAGNRVNNKYEAALREVLRLADVKIGGKRAQDIEVHNDELYRRVLSKGTMGVGESYMDGWWNARKLDVTITQVLMSDADQKIRDKQLLWYALRSRVGNPQSGSRSYKNARAHYDIGNDLYEPMLGKSMAYSCAYWEWGAKTLDQAQVDKYDLIAKKLKLKKGMKVLDIGCGWGGLAMHLAKKYGCEVVGLTPSKQQYAYIRSHAKGLNVKPRLTTWQDFDSKTQFDRLVSVGAMEHFGPKNYAAFYRKAQGWIKPDGLFLLHTIGGNKSVEGFDPWMNKYIFPGGVIPSGKQLAEASEGVFIMEDWHNMGANYDKSLMSWYKNFKATYASLDHEVYDERFRRMWEFYLLSCAALFRAREMQLWQIVYSPHGVPGGYHSVR